MKLNILMTDTECIDLPKEINCNQGDSIIINDKEYIIEKAKYHIVDGKIYQKTYISHKKVPLTKVQANLLLSIGLPVYCE